MRSKSSFLRQLIIAGFVYDVDYSYLREYNYLLAKIGANLNPIAKRVNETRSIYQADMDEIKWEMEKLCMLTGGMQNTPEFTAKVQEGEKLCGA